MRTTPLLTLALLIGISGCSALGLFGSKGLTMDDVTGRYRFVEVAIEPASDALRDKRLTGDVISDDVSLLLLSDGSARLEALRGDRVDATISTGTFTIKGRDVSILFNDEAALQELSLPTKMTLSGGKGKLEGDIFQEGVNLEAVSNDYRGITEADINLKIRMRIVN